MGKWGNQIGEPKLPKVQVIVGMLLLLLLNIIIFI
jgi:hypothetical protein